MRKSRPRSHRESIGCLNIHTAYGIGVESFQEITTAAIDSRLDFIVITDRNTLRGQRLGMEGWYDRTAVIVGEEVTRDDGHCLALGTREEISEGDGHARDVLAEIERQKGIRVIMHPHAGEDPLNPGEDPSWRDWSEADAEALALWTFLDDWKAGLTSWNFKKRLTDPALHLQGPKPETLAQWDAMLRERPVSAIALLDAQGSKRRSRRSGSKIFSSRELFGTLRMHLFTPPFTRRFFEDKLAILDALKCGRGFLANDALAAAEGFRFEVRCSDGEVIPMGQPTPFRKGMTLRVLLPRCAAVRLISDGQAWFSKNDVTSLEVELNQAITVRLEARLGEKPWIFSNPIHIR
ncbi:hypothetical protein JXA47_05075 [Candidatus Sumerlaeota bacterium]|nr:hypothetical protein [Candidatus Sumerlaeota bacterium]